MKKNMYKILALLILQTYSIIAADPVEFSKISSTMFAAKPDMSGKVPQSTIILPGTPSTALNPALTGASTSSNSLRAPTGTNSSPISSAGSTQVASVSSTTAALPASSVGASTSTLDAGLPSISPITVHNSPATPPAASEPVSRTSTAPQIPEPSITTVSGSILPTAAGSSTVTIQPKTGPAQTPSTTSSGLPTVNVPTPATSVPNNSTSTATPGSVPSITNQISTGTVSSPTASGTTATTSTATGTAPKATTATPSTAPSTSEASTTATPTSPVPNASAAVAAPKIAPAIPVTNTISQAKTVPTTAPTPKKIDDANKKTATISAQQLAQEAQTQKSLKTKKPKKERKYSGDIIDFTFDNTPLTEVIRRYADKKKLNVVMPQQTHAIQQKINFKPARPVTLEEAEKYLALFLDYAGYTISPGTEYSLIVKEKEAIKNILPLYVYDSVGSMQLEDLPYSDTYVRVIYYFSNLKVGDQSNNPVTAILKDVLSEPESVITDPVSNGVVITDKARVIRSALQLLRELDFSSSRYKLDTLQLYNASASQVVDLLKGQILAAAGKGSFGTSGADSTTGATSFFSTNIRAVADDRRNTLIIWGKEAAVNRLKEFVREYMDAPLESGKSIFHVYDLKYLDAESFAGVLSQIVQSGAVTDQTSSARSFGPRRFFEGVVVKAETYKPFDAAATPGGGAGNTDFGDANPAGAAGTVYRGGNRILIAATPQDWEQIKKLIDQLDIPQRQVIIEVLIVDYTRNEQKAINSQVRNLERMDFRPGVGFQAANSNANILTNANENPSNIVGDLLRLTTTDPGSTIISGLTPGTFVLALNDPAGTGIWGIFELLDLYGNTKILSHPYLVALNNTPATVVSEEVRRASGDGSSAQGGAVVVNIQDFVATLSVSITPRISSSDRLNLEVLIKISQFQDPTGFVQVTRQLQTNVNMSSPDQVLVLGGLTRVIKTYTATETPVLGRIPLIGWFFRGTQIAYSEAELGVFIRPTIVEPLKRGSMNSYTHSKIAKGSQPTDTYLLGNEKDPIVRFFFGTTPPEEPLLEEYMQENNIVPETDPKLAAKAYQSTIEGNIMSDRSPRSMPVQSR